MIYEGSRPPEDRFRGIRIHFDGAGRRASRVARGRKARVTLRVCFLAPELLPNQGGVGTYSIELLRQIAGKVDLTVLTPVRRKGKETYSRERIEEFFGHKFRVETVSEAADSFLYNRAFQWGVLRHLRRLLQKDRFDLIHSQHAHMPDILSRPMVNSTPTIRTIHTTIRGQGEGIRMAEQLGGGLEESERWQVALQPPLRAAEWLLLSRRDPALTVSAWMRKELAKDGVPEERVRVTYLGADAERFRPAAREPGFLTTDPDTRVVLFPGRPTLVKGSAILAQAIPLILRDFPNAEFVFTGGESADFLVLLRTLGEQVRRKVRFLGYVPYDRLPSVFASADVGVVPTLYENLPIRLLEFMASGVPVVASNICGIPEAVVSGRTGLLVPPASPQALATSVSTLLKNDDVRVRMGAEARQSAVENFTWTRTGEQTLAAYQDVVDRRW